MRTEPTAPVAVSLDDAAQMTSMSRRTIERAIHAGHLVAHYPTSRPVVLVSDLTAWIESAPTESSR